VNTAEIMKIQLWDASDVARYLNVSLSWVRQRVSANAIPFVRIGGWMVRFRPDDIQAFSTALARGKVLTVKGRDGG
jgi:excisionase family DNA binding protein